MAIASRTAVSTPSRKSIAAKRRVTRAMWPGLSARRRFRAAEQHEVRSPVLEAVEGLVRSSGHYPPRENGQYEGARMGSPPSTWPGPRRTGSFLLADMSPSPRSSDVEDRLAPGSLFKPLIRLTERT